MSGLWQQIMRRLAARQLDHSRLPAAIALCLIAAATMQAQQSGSTTTQQPSGQSAANPASETSGVITGQIITDDGRAAGRANIMVTPVGRTEPGTRSFPTATIDEAGNFRIPGLAPGSYLLNVTLRGYVLVSESGSVNQLNGTHRPGDVVTIKMAKGGVITGRVTNSKGEPVIAAKVQALSVTTAQGNLSRDFIAGERQTDDRGVYRIYGLQPGTYVVRVGGKGRSSSQPVPYERYVPDYHPSSSRAEAVTVAISAGEEARGIDISFRGQLGYELSGTLTGAVQAGTSPAFINVMLVSAANGVEAASARLQAGESQFTMRGLSDGEYLLIADKTGSSDNAASPPQRVTIKGADVNGVSLSLLPLGSIAGRVVIEAASKEQPACPPARSPLLESLTVAALRDQPGTREGLLLPSTSMPGGRLNAKSEFVMLRVEAGRYYLSARSPDGNWFVRSITQAAAPPAKAPRNAGREGVTLKPGERTEGVTITLAEGAAGLRGRVVADKEGMELPARLRVHLIPADPAAADDVLHYAQATVGSGGNFFLTNLTPGRYWLIARVLTDEKTTGPVPRLIAWDSGERAKLRREAEAAKVEIELQPCQRVSDYTLRYALPLTK